MREWHLPREQLPKITVAADARLAKPNFLDDQIWEISLRDGEPPAISTQTTYGLRARSMRMFPRFTEGDNSLHDPESFHQPPVIHRFFTNYTLLTYSPFSGIDVVAEYWVPESNIITGRLRIINSGVTPRKLNLAWIALLFPREKGERMNPNNIDSANILTGQVHNLAPVIFITGGPETSHSPYPSLQVSIDLLPGLEKKFQWVHAAASTVEESFQLARSTAKRNWDGEIARIELTNAALLEVYTGNLEWDLAFALGQTTALGLVHGPSEHLPHRSFVQTRHNEQGYSFLENGTDYDHTWNGQTPLELWYLSQFLLPAAPEIAKDILRNFIAVQEETGFIDWRPSMSGKRSGLLATPLLTDIAWRIYQVTEDVSFLVETFHPLLDFFHAWFKDSEDRNKDGIPEWAHPLHSGFEDNPVFTHWQPWSQGVAISLFESPSLTAFLLRECLTLQKIAAELDQQNIIESLSAKEIALRNALERTWDASATTYTYLDRVAHTNPRGKSMGKRKGPGSIQLGRFKFEAATRLLIRIHPAEESGRQAVIRIKGVNTHNEPVEELIPAEKIRWPLGTGVAVSETLFFGFDQLEIEAVGEKDEIKVFTVDYQHHDHTLLLPIWVEALNKQQAASFIRKIILNPSKYWHGYGIRACTTCPAPEAATICESVWMPWNSLIGEGLLNYGEYIMVAELVSRLLDGVTQNLIGGGSFRKHYHAQTGAGIGERNSINGLPPLGLFLAVLGVEIISPWKVVIARKNPFPFPVKIKFKGLTIRQEEEKTAITFPSGQHITVDDQAPCIVNGKSSTEAPQKPTPTKKRRFGR